MTKHRYRERCLVAAISLALALMFTMFVSSVNAAGPNTDLALTHSTTLTATLPDAPSGTVAATNPTAITHAGCMAAPNYDQTSTATWLASITLSHGLPNIALTKEYGPTLTMDVAGLTLASDQVAGSVTMTRSFGLLFACDTGKRSATDLAPKVESSTSLIGEPDI